MSGKSQAKEIPRSSGVYQVRCIATRQIYIGSAVDLRARWISHRRALRRGEHRNRFLQEAWNQYGEASFEFSVLELVVDSERLQSEQSWIDRTGCTDRAIGFNIYPIAGSPGELNAQLWEGFIDPDGNEITIFNLYEFCRQRGLDFPSMHRPDGQRVVITNLKAFCQEQGLGCAHMHEVKSGKRKSHKGWTWRKNE